MSPPGQTLPWGITKEEVERVPRRAPRRARLHSDLRTVVRRATSAELRRDLGKLRQYPALDTLHPGLRRELEGLKRGPTRSGSNAVPYSVLTPTRGALGTRS